MRTYNTVRAYFVPHLWAEEFGEIENEKNERMDKR